MRNEPSVVPGRAERSEVPDTTNPAVVARVWEDARRAVEADRWAQVKRSMGLQPRLRRRGTVSQATQLTDP